MQDLANKNGKDFLNYLNGKSGVYFITNELPTNATQRFLVKVGMAQSVLDFDRQVRVGGLKTRLEQYLLYYPRGYHIFGLYVTQYNRAYEVEREVQSYLAGKGRKSDFPHSHSEEWFLLSRNDVRYVIHQFKTLVNVIDSVEFNPPYFLTTNPSAGRQRKVPEMSTPQRRYHEENMDDNIIDTLKKRKRSTPINDATLAKQLFKKK